jgi:hypothetical protein
MDQRCAKNDIIDAREQATHRSATRTARAAGAAAFSNKTQICLGACVLVHNSGALVGEIPEGLPPTVNQFAHHHMWNPGKPDEETEIEAAARKLLQVEAAA